MSSQYKTNKDSRTGNSKMSSYKIGGKRGLKINDEKINSKIIKSLESYININDRGYKFLDNSTLNYLKINKHLVALSTFGKKFLLYFTKIEDKKYCLYYNRKTKEVISVRYRFKDDIFNNTLIDGELLKDTDTENWRFSVSDILVYKGTNLNKHVLEERLEFLNEMLTEEYISDDNFDVALFDVKQYFEYKHIEDLYNTYMEAEPYRCSGFLFKNIMINEKYMLYIFQENRTKKTVEVSKIKQTTHTSQSPIKSFQIKKTDLPDIYELYCSKEGSIFKYAYAGVTTLNNSLFIVNMFNGVSHNTDIYVKCSYNRLFEKWVPFGADETIDDYENIKFIESCEN
jgi:hypothetical protein